MRAHLLAAALAAASLPAAANAADERFWDDASTVGEVSLVAAGFALSAAHGDEDGALQLGGSLGAAFATTEILKRTFPTLRPDGSDRRSFPSGHTSVSFAAAASIHRRHGWEAGVPATVVAAFVGYARVRADRHRWEDVVVGAAIGEAAGLLITRPRNANVALVPWASTREAGVTVSAAF